MCTRSVSFVCLCAAPCVRRVGICLTSFSHTHTCTSPQTPQQEFACEAGPKLQSILEEYARGKENWLEEIWDTLAYLTDRTSLRRTNVYASSLEFTPFRTPLLQTARIVYGLLQFHDMIEK